MMIVDAITALEQLAPFVGLLAFSIWMRRDFLQAQREVDAFLARLKAIEARLAADDQGTKAAEPVSQKDPEPVLPARPLPTATARYRT
jgi:hypothetical protein